MKEEKGKPAPRRRHLRVAQAAPRRRRLPFLIAWCLLIAPLVLGVVTVQTLVSENAFRMRELSRQTVALHESYKELTLTVAELSSPRRIAREARRLGLQLPEQVHMLAVGSVEEPSPEGEGPSQALKPLIEPRP
jgi:cell division protein FtsL